MYTASWYGALRARPNVYTPSIVEEGHDKAITVELVRAKQAAPNRMGAGWDVQNQSSPVLAEKRVRKSEMETFKYIDVVICP